LVGLTGLPGWLDWLGWLAWLAGLAGWLGSLAWLAGLVGGLAGCLAAWLLVAWLPGFVDAWLPVSWPSALAQLFSPLWSLLGLVPPPIFAYHSGSPIWLLVFFLWPWPMTLVLPLTLRFRFLFACPRLCPPIGFVILLPVSSHSPLAHLLLSLRVCKYKQLSPALPFKANSSSHSLSYWTLLRLPALSLSCHGCCLVFSMSRKSQYRGSKVWSKWSLFEVLSHLVNPDIVGCIRIQDAPTT
jgi:hypothetical protein